MYGVGTHLSLQRNIYKECMARLPFLKRSKSLNIDRINIKFRNFVYLDTLFLAIRVLWCHRQYLGNSYSGFTVWKRQTVHHCKGGTLIGASEHEYLRTPLSVSGVKPLGNSTVLLLTSSKFH